MDSISSSDLTWPARERIIALADGPFPLVNLEALMAVDRALEFWKMDQVLASRDGGATWDQIGKAMGMTRQAVHQAYAKSVDRAYGPFPQDQD